MFLALRPLHVIFYEGHCNYSIIPFVESAVNIPSYTCMKIAFYTGVITNVYKYHVSAINDP